MLLTGTFARAVDQKLRIAVPKHFREAIQTADATTVYIAPGTDGSLAVYGEQAFNRLAERLSGASPTGEQTRAFARLFYGRAQAAEIDKQGRIRIPPELAQWAGLVREAVLVGIQDHMEVWDRQRWDDYSAAKQKHYDQIAEAAFEQRAQP